MEKYAIFHSYVSLTEGNPSMKMSANQVFTSHCSSPRNHRHRATRICHRAEWPFPGDQPSACCDCDWMESIGMILSHKKVGGSHLEKCFVNIVCLPQAKVILPKPRPKYWNTSSELFVYRWASSCGKLGFQFQYLNAIVSVGYSIPELSKLQH